MTNEQTSPPPHPPAGGSPKGPIWPWIVGLLLLVIAGTYAWKLLAVREVRGELEAQRDTLVASSDRALADRTEALLRLSAVPLGWAVGSEMLRRNYERADALLGELVGVPGVQMALVGVPGDSVLLATDRDLEGRRFSSLFPAELLRRTEPGVTRTEGTYTLAVPLLGPTRALGVLVVVYRPDELRPAGEEGPAAPDAAPGATAYPRPTPGR